MTIPRSAKIWCISVLRLWETDASFRLPVEYGPGNLLNLAARAAALHQKYIRDLSPMLNAHPSPKCPYLWGQHAAGSPTPREVAEVLNVYDGAYMDVASYFVIKLLCNISICCVSSTVCA